MSSRRLCVCDAFCDSGCFLKGFARVLPLRRLPNPLSLNHRVCMVKKKETTRWSVLSLMSTTGPQICGKSETPKNQVKSSTTRHASRRSSAGRWFGRNCGTSMSSTNRWIWTMCSEEKRIGVIPEHPELHFNTHECTTNQQWCRQC